MKPPSPQSAIVCRPGYANCAPNALGAALAMDAQENEPKSLRSLPPLTCPCQPYAGRARVGEKHRVVGGKFAQRRGQEFRTDGLDPRSLLDVVLQKLVERFRLRDDACRESCRRSCRVTLLSKAATVALMSPTSPRSTAVRRPMCLGFLSIWTFFTLIAGKELREGKVRAEQQQEFGVMNGAVGSAVTEQAGHANGIGIVVFQPLLAAERIADRRLESCRPVRPPHRGHPCSRRRRRSLPSSHRRSSSTS